MGGPAVPEPPSSLPTACSDTLESSQPSSARNRSGQCGQTWVRNMDLTFHDILSAAVREYDHLQDYASKLSKENFILRQKLVLAREASRSHDRSSPRKTHSVLPTNSADSKALESCSSQAPPTRKACTTSPPPRKILSNLMCSCSSEHTLTSSTRRNEARSAVTGVLHFPPPACGDLDGPMGLPSTADLAYSEEAPERLAPPLQASVPETAIPQRWEAQADQGWMPFAPGVYFRGFAGEEVQYQIGSAKYKAEFYSEASGVQINLSTLKQRALRRYEEINEQDSSDTNHSGGSELSHAEATLSVMRKCPRPASRKLTPVFTIDALRQLKDGGSCSSSAAVNEFGETSEGSGLSVATSLRCNQSARSCVAEGGNTGIRTARSEASIEAVALTTSGRSHWNAPVLCNKVAGDETYACNVLEVDCGGHHMDVRGFLPRALAATVDAPLFEARERRENRRRTSGTDDSWSDWDDSSDYPEACDWNLNMPGHMFKGITTERSEPIVTPRPPDKPSCYHHMVPHSPRFLPTPRETSEEELNAAVSVS